MTINLADLQRWDPEAIDELAHAAAARARTSREKAAELPRLAMFETWEGDSGRAAHDAMSQMSTRLDVSAQTAVMVALGAGKVYGEAREIKAQLAALFDYANAAPAVDIDTVTNTVIPPDTTGWADADVVELQAKVTELQNRIALILGEGEVVDAELAAVLNKAIGNPMEPDMPAHSPIPLSKDPKEFHDRWSRLTAEEKFQQYQHDHNIGNHDGMPATDRDFYNRMNLDAQLDRAREAGARADALRAEHPDWATDHAGGADPGYHNAAGYQEWKRKYDDACHDARYLADLEAVDHALAMSPDRHLMLLDTVNGKQARAAIAVGNPDTATHVSVTTPGLNTTVHGAMESMADEATLLRGEAQRQLSLTPGRATDSVSAIAWIGYDAPQISGEGLGSKITGAWGVSHDDLARSGAKDLARFYDGIQASHVGGPVDLTAIGHSYGSLTTGLALQEPGDHGVSRALFYGSPGIEASTPAQLQLQPGQVFTMATPDDPIRFVYDARAAGLGVPIVGTYLNEAFPDFGPNPATNPNFTHLETGAATVSRGGTSLVLEAAQGHSDYPRFPDGGGLRTTNYNIAAVLAGLTPIGQN